MDVKQYITLAVGLIVGVLLIAGVVTPVIANVSSDNGGSGSGVETDITGFDRYAKVTESTDVTIYPYYDNDTGLYGYSYTNPSEPDAQIIPLYGNTFIVGDGWAAHMEGPSWVIEWEGENYDVILHISYDSTVATGYILGTSTQVTLNLPVAIFYPSPDGEYVDPYRHDAASDQSIDLPYYANSNTEICCEIDMEGDFGQILWEMYVVGTISDNSAWINDNEGGLTYTDTATFTIEDGIATTVSVTVDGNTYNVPLSLQSGDDYEGYEGFFLVLPVSVYEGGGSGGSGIPSTLTTILSVIPLVLTVGLVIGAIGFFRMKN